MLLVVSAAVAQINTLPVRTVDGRAYHYYEVKQKETIYSISRQLGVDRAYIERYNPSVADGLKAGQVLYFPASTDAPRAVHVVADKETLYGISRRYNITVDQLKEWNPAVSDGIRPGQRLYVSAPTEDDAPKAAVAAEPASEPAATDGHTDGYTIRDGESLYRIAVNNGTTVDTILALNPGLDRDNYQAGTVIKLPAKEATDATPSRPKIEASTMPVNPPVAPVEPVAVAPAEPDTVAAPAPAANTANTANTYRVGKHETFYSIAHANGITVEALEKANPTVGILEEGMILNIPMTAPEVAVVETETPAEPLDDDPTAGMISAPEVEQVNIALMLPLMLNDAERAKQARLYTEFYQGFLLAVDSLCNCGTPIHLQVYDTESSAERVASILATPELQEADIIVAPDSEAHLSMISNWAADNDVAVLNLFVVKDESYRTNPMVMQGNIPHDEMYLKAINGLTGRFARYMPVILQRKEGPDDKAEFIAALRNNLDVNMIPYRVIEFDGTLKDSDLADLPTDGAYAFIPASGRQPELNRIAPTLIEWSRTLADPDPIRLFGYPEWITFRGETLVNMHKLNTLAYSRFYTVPDDPLVRNIDESFKRWYGVEMSNFVPRQGLFGFDTGMFLINALSRPHVNGFEPYDGVQNGFNFVKAENSRGWINDELYFINFRPSGLIDKISL